MTGDAPHIRTRWALPESNVGLGSWPWRRARIDADAPAVRQGDRSLTYAELDDQVRRMARVLADAGVGHGDRVAYLGANDLMTFVTLFAAGWLGAIFVPLNTRLSAAEITYLLGDCRPGVLVHSEALVALVPAEADRPEGLRTVLVLGSPSREADQVHRAIASALPLSVPAAVDLSDPALLIYTSGTTGRAKGALLTHGNLTWNTVNQLAHLDVLSTDRALCAAPLFHIAGLGQVTLPTLFKGGSIEVHPGFQAGEVLATVQRRRITSLSLVPIMLELMCEHRGWADSDLGSLRYVVYGGSPVQERVARAWLDRGIELRQGFGMTEASPGVFMAPSHGARERPVSIGRPHFYTDVALLDDDGPRPLGDRPGELIVRGPHVFAGYWQRPTETAASFYADADADAMSGRWFRTGDVVRTESDGWSYAVDRAKDMIISGGENIYPAEIEAVLVELAGVAAAAVVAVPDDRWGEVGAAFLTCQPGSSLTEDEVRGHLGAALARYKIPKYIRFVVDLPTNTTGKIRRTDLRPVALDLAKSGPAGATKEGVDADRVGS